MTWRRFTQGSFGALSARQYTEVQDTVQSLASHVGVSTANAAYIGRPTLVRLKGKFGTSVPAAGSVPGSDGIRAQAYNFRQILVRVSDSGSVEVAEREYGLKSDPPDGRPDVQRALAIDFEGTDYPDNTIVMIAPIDVDMGENRDALPERQSLYAILSPPQTVTIGVYVVVGTLPEGMYIVRKATQNTAPSEPMENLYETSAYYGALLPPQNPCATMVPRRLVLGDRVFGFMANGMLYTCAPTAWSVECQPCGTAPIQAEDAYGAAASEGYVVGKMLGG